MKYDEIFNQSDPDYDKELETIKIKLHIYPLKKKHKQTFVIK
jgi:hypothetical protein